ncbi:MAG: CCA tRNA nucleotidyltransferase [Cytophagales bacterium]|nr:CCA tRNA nucleotidyltransferase [Cytophagales bacterium]MDW8385202.1 HD domain-containing protein [Flammeovirgaceae bacterium]
MNLQEKLQDEIFEIIASCGQELGYPVYLVGGYVRDLLLNRACKDIDVVCVGSGLTLAERVAQKCGKGTQTAFFKNFGTAKVKIKEWDVEFVGARKESYERHSRKPFVENGTLEDDQKRRDFTINALAISLNPENYGELIDPFDGLSHLKNKIVVTPSEPDITFSDDPLRMMRAIRFATQLNFDIHPDTFDAIRRNKNRIEIVSMERITTELNKIILSSKPSYGFKLLDAAGLLEIIFPEFVALKGTEYVDGKGHKDNFYHTLQVLDNLSKISDDLWLRWAALLHDIAKPLTKRFDPKLGWTFHGHDEKGARMVSLIFRKFRLPLNEKMKFVEKMVRLHLRPIGLAKEGVTDSAIRRLIFEAGEDFDDLMKLCKADVTTKNHEKFKQVIQNFEKVIQRAAEVEERDKLRNFQPVITGEIIMETFDLKPCKLVGELKFEVREAILEGIIPNTFEEAYAYLLEVAKKRQLFPVRDLRSSQDVLLNSTNL